MTRAVWMCSVLSVALVGAAMLKADDKAAELKVGDKAPAFEAVDDQGKPWKSEDHVGKKILVVYFYPADCTGGCTAQAKGFQADLKKLEEKDVEVIGVSGDSADNHQVFKKKEGLTFTLLADPEGKVAKALGVPFTAGKKEAKTKIDGQDVTLTREGTAQRWTVVIGKDGKVISKENIKKAGDNSKDILKLVEAK
jgi:peroxiredoxin Q/BCP